MKLEKKNGKWIDVDKLEAKPNKAIKQPKKVKQARIPKKGKTEPKQ